MKILYINFANSPEDKKAWSGTIYKVYKSLLETGAEIDYFCCQTSLTIFEKYQIHFTYYINRLLNRTKKVKTGYSFVKRNAIAKNLTKINFENYDFVFITAFSVIASALHRCLYNKKDSQTKYIFLADATFSAIENYYPTTSNLSKRSSYEANEISKDAFEGAYKIIVSSEWAKRHAMFDYGIDRTKIYVIEFGANIESEMLGKIQRIYYNKHHYELLLSGVDWIRKGGDVAVECVKELYARGYDVTLNIVGMDVPDEYRGLDFIKSHGFLNKNYSDQYQHYLDILLNQDMLLFPSKAECSAIALCEAAGMGLPVFCYDTGGLANYVIDGVNGYRLDLSATGKNFADKIESCLANNELGRLSKGANQIYQEKLNWGTWSNRVKKSILI